MEIHNTNSGLAKIWIKDYKVNLEPQALKQIENITYFKTNFMCQRLVELWDSIIELNTNAMDWVGKLYNEYFDN
jgi:hypothetical protein